MVEPHGDSFYLTRRIKFDQIMVLYLLLYPANLLGKSSIGHHHAAIKHNNVSTALDNIIRNIDKRDYESKINKKNFYNVN